MEQTFFMPDERIEFVDFGRLDAFGLRGLVGQGVGVRGDPVGHSLMDDAELPGDAPQVHPIGVQAQRLDARLLIISVGRWLWGVGAPTGAAQVPLAPRGVAPVLHLPGATLARRTGSHAST
jgi:hypothetical protein